MDKLESYLRNHSAVPGWLDPYSASFIASLARIQREAGMTGPVVEIGVHMGRLFILLKLLTSGQEKALAIDIFADQHLNVDQSGHGDMAEFGANIARYATAENLEIIQRSSLDVTREDILSQVGACRLFSIDGGHTEECTLNDLRLAERSLMDGGVVILDDYFNPSWPDVSTGAARYFLETGSRLRPFAISPNKLFLARPENHAFYHAGLLRLQRSFHEKQSHMFGSEVAIYGVDPATHALPKAARRWVRGSVIGPRLIEVRQRLRTAAGR
ncbi:MAG: class I SAM-dependent methyltransferase [Beijerinckiaceae bacterium]